jgi:hypothetical protein
MKKKSTSQMTALLRALERSSSSFAQRVEMLGTMLL